MTGTPDLQQVLASLAQFSQSRISNVQPISQEWIKANEPPSHAQHARPVIDPATIVSWQEGLRCVTKIAAQNKHFEESIRRLMRTQRAQEMQWYRERRDLKLLQANRGKSSAQAMSILSSLTSGPTQATDPAQAEVDATKELAALDMRIYDAQRQMQTGMSYELKALGVPFFGTRRELIAADEGSTAKRSDGSATLLSKAELAEYQKRMVDYLEALYRE